MSANPVECLKSPRTPLLFFSIACDCIENLGRDVVLANAQLESRLNTWPRLRPSCRRRRRSLVAGPHATLQLAALTTAAR
eukprot:3455417-Prymnesium_polylepis.1